VDEEKVHFVKPQLAQALLESPPGLVCPMLAIGELGRDEDLIARQFAAPESLPDALLVLISLSGVDQPVSGCQRDGDRLSGLLRYTSCGGCARAPDSNITGASRSCSIAARAASRSAASSSSVDDTNTRSRRSGVLIADDPAVSHRHSASPQIALTCSRTEVRLARHGSSLCAVATPADHGHDGNSNHLTRFYFAGLLFHGRLDVELFITDTLIPRQIRAPRQH
jgi:hypothetical protein